MLQIFGVYHFSGNPQPAVEILRARPQYVLVESAIDRAHGAQTGGAVALNDVLNSGERMGLRHA
jgi:hypothetical protein